MPMPAPAPAEMPFFVLAESPCPAPAELPFPPSSWGESVFVGVDEGEDALEESVADADADVDVAEDAEDADEVLVAASNALLSTVHQVGDARAEVPVALEGCLTSPFRGSTKKWSASSSQHDASTAPQQYMFFPQSTSSVPVEGAMSGRVRSAFAHRSRPMKEQTYQRTSTSSHPSSDWRSTVG
jgi:hypothetical protein